MLPLLESFSPVLAQLAWKRSLYWSWWPEPKLEPEWLHQLLLFRRDLPEVNYLLAEQLLLLPKQHLPKEESAYCADVLFEAGLRERADLLYQRLDSGRQS